MNLYTCKIGAVEYSALAADIQEAFEKCKAKAEEVCNEDGLRAKPIDLIYSIVRLTSIDIE